MRVELELIAILFNVQLKDDIEKSPLIKDAFGNLVAGRYIRLFYIKSDIELFNWKFAQNEFVKRYEQSSRTDFLKKE